MNKFFLLLLAINAISLVTLKEALSKKINTNVDPLIKGISKAKESKCSTDLFKQQTKIDEIAKNAINDIVEGEGVKITFKKASNKLLEIGKSISECVGLYLPEAYNKFFTEKGQKEIYQNINNNIVKIRLYEEKIKDDINNKNYNEAALSFGKILSIVLDSNIIQI